MGTPCQEKVCASVLQISINRHLWEALRVRRFHSTISGILKMKRFLSNTSYNGVDCSTIQPLYSMSARSYRQKFQNSIVVLVSLVVCAEKPLNPPRSLFILVEHALVLFLDRGFIAIVCRLSTGVCLYWKKYLIYYVQQQGLLSFLPQHLAAVGGDYRQRDGDF